MVRRVMKANDRVKLGDCFEVNGGNLYRLSRLDADKIGLVYLSGDNPAMFSGEHPMKVTPSAMASNFRWGDIVSHINTWYAVDVDYAVHWQYAKDGIEDGTKLVGLHRDGSSAVYQVHYPNRLHRISDNEWYVLSSGKLNIFEDTDLGSLTSQARQKSQRLRLAEVTFHKPEGL